MSLADLSISRPTFISCIVALMIGAGLVSLSRLGVDQFPDVTFPVVFVSVPYPGAGPSEVESLVAKPLEDELSTLSGIKRLSSESREGVAVVIAEFTLETDVKYAEQQIRDRVGAAKSKLPLDIREPTIRRLDPADQPVLQLALDADLPPAKLFDLADDKIRPMLEQTTSVGLVEVIGGRKREIHVSLDRSKLKAYELSVSGVAQRLAGSGEDIPSGKKSQGQKETVFRTVGQFTSLSDIGALPVNFFGNDVPVRVRDVGTIEDTLEDANTEAYFNGKKTLFLTAYKQSGSNTIKVVEALKKKVDKINAQIASQPGAPKLTIVRDGSIFIRANVYDVQESIIIGIILAVVVVYLFLGSGRSTIITGLALPNSLIGAFLLMAVAGFSINIMTLLALSLSVGLLVDDAIVVRENIFRHVEMGKKPLIAALEGTKEVTLAVVATTLTVVAVFGPLGFLTGVVGQFFKQFGLTVVFAMLISLFDALTIAPMLSAYFAGPAHPDRTGLWGRSMGRVLDGFNRFQDNLELKYEKLLKYTVAHPLMVLVASVIIFFLCTATVGLVPKTFLPTQDAGEFTVSLDLPPGTNLETMSETALKVDEIVRKNPEVRLSAISVGSKDGDPNKANSYVRLVDSKKRTVSTSEFKARLREQLSAVAYANPVVKDYDPIGGGQRPFTLLLLGNDRKILEEQALRVAERLKKYNALLDVDVNFRPGKPELQVRPDKVLMQQLGATTVGVGSELRAQVTGLKASKYREEGLEYDIRVRLREDQRDIRKDFDSIFVPNINGSLIRLSAVAKPLDATGPSKITRQDRSRYVQVDADIAPGAGLGDALSEVGRIVEQEIKLPAGVNYKFVGQAEDFAELGKNMLFAMLAGVVLIFLVLASLYESFVTPLTIMLAMPLAICGCFVALAMAQESLNIFSMIGMVMLLGVAVKNSILLVDYANQKLLEGVSRDTAIIQAGKARLRPILMTTMALIAGTIPIAIGLNEASKQRTSMGVAIIGGLISSTLLTLVVVPAAYSYIDRFRVWSKEKMTRLFASSAA